MLSVRLSVSKTSQSEWTDSDAIVQCACIAGTFMPLINFWGSPSYTSP